MKKYIFVIIAAALGFAGCSHSDNEDDVKQSPKVKFTVAATKEDAKSENQQEVKSETRAVMNDSYQPVWTENDEIVVAAEGIGEFWMSSTSTNGKYATFEGDAGADPGIYTFYAANNAMWVDVYDDIAEAWFSISKGDQDGTPNLFMVSTAEDIEVAGVNSSLEFKFKIVNSLLRIDISKLENIESVTIKSVSGEYIAGTYVYDYKTKTASILEDEDASASIIVWYPEDVFYFVLPADITFSNGFLLIFTNTDGENMILKTGTGKTLNRATYYFTPDITPRAPFVINKTIKAETSYSTYLESGAEEANQWVATDCRVSGPISYSNKPTWLQITERGYLVNNVYYPTTDDNGDVVDIPNMPFGAHAALTYIKDQFGNYYESDLEDIYITGLPYNTAMIADLNWTSTALLRYNAPAQSATGIVLTSSGTSATITGNSPMFFQFTQGGKVAYTLRGETVTNSALNFVINGQTFNILPEDKGEKKFEGTFTIPGPFQITSTATATRANLVSKITEVTLNYAD